MIISSPPARFVDGYRMELLTTLQWQHLKSERIQSGDALLMKKPICGEDAAGWCAGVLDFHEGARRFQVSPGRYGHLVIKPSGKDFALYGYGNLKPVRGPLLFGVLKIAGL